MSEIFRQANITDLREIVRLLPENVEFAYDGLVIESKR
jgi:hypothetical protein